jgi:Transposase DNA-binding
MIARFLIGRFMSNMLLAPAQWAQNEFGFAQLGDQLRNQRLVKIATHLAAQPGGTLPQAFPDWAERWRTWGDLSGANKTANQAGKRSGVDGSA